MTDADSDALIADARAAEAAFDWEAAAEAYERALTERSHADAPPVEQARLLASLGHCYRMLGEARTAWRSFMRAISIFRDAGETDAMVDTTLDALYIWSPPDRRHGLAQAALDMLGPGPSRRHVYLLFGLDRDQEGIDMATAENYEEILLHEEVWLNGQQMVLDGRVDEYLALVRRVHALRDEQGDFDRAAGPLRGAGFGLLGYGDFDRGLVMAEEAAGYARERNMRFQHQLAALDIAGVYFARGELDRCEALLDDIAGDLDFRKDLLRAWVAERRGDMDAAVALLPSPDRAGGAQGALTQVHSGRAGVLWRAGRHDAARRDLEAFAEAGTTEQGLLYDAPAAYECIVEAGDERLWNMIRSRDTGPEKLNRYSTLQGRGLDRARGGIALCLGLRDEAAAHFRAGVDWAERTRCAVDAAQCRDALRALASDG
jgi:tetratricopeptide (TPR) repeat protein